MDKGHRNGYFDGRPTHIGIASNMKAAPTWDGLQLNCALNPFTRLGLFSIDLLEKELYVILEVVVCPVYCIPMC